MMQRGSWGYNLVVASPGVRGQQQQQQPEQHLPLQREAEAPASHYRSRSPRRSPRRPSRSAASACESEGGDHDCDGAGMAGNALALGEMGPESALSLDRSKSSSSRLQANPRLSFTSRLEEYRSFYQRSSRDDLLKELVLKDEQLKQAEKDNKALKQRENTLSKSLRASRQRGRRLDKALIKAKATASKSRKPGKQTVNTPGKIPDRSVEERMVIQRTGRDGDGRYLTVPSMISMAIRRNLTNAACQDVPLVLLDNASRWTIARCEVKTGSSLLASCQAFHDAMRQESFPPTPMDSNVGVDVVDGPRPAQGRFNLTVHVISQDATNSAIWMKSKLCALILHSAYLTDTTLADVFHKWDFRKQFDSLRMVADVQPVGDGSSVGTLALTVKMLQSVGCPSPQDAILIHENAWLGVKVFSIDLLMYSVWPQCLAVFELV